MTKSSHLIRRTLMMLSLLASMTFCAPTFAAKPPKASEDMILILIHHKSGAHELAPKALPLDKTKSFPPKTAMNEYELYVVPYPQGTADVFEFRVFLHVPSGHYWIHKSGGVGGVNEFYGPGDVKALRK